MGQSRRRGMTVATLASLVGLVGACTVVGHQVRLPAPISFVTGVEPGPVRSDYGGWVGMKITLNAPVTVTALGRIIVTGNQEPHTVKIVQSSDGKDIASVAVSVAGGKAGKFAYGELDKPVILEANVSYYVVTSEEIDRDQWYHSTTKIRTTPVATCDSAVYWSNVNSEWTTEAVENNTFGPVNFKYKYMK